MLSKNPDPPILAFFDFLAFFRFPIFLAFSCVFPSFSKDFRASAKRETLSFLGEKTLAFSKKARVGGSGSGVVFTRGWFSQRGASSYWERGLGSGSGFTEEF